MTDQTESGDSGVKESSSAFPFSNQPSSSQGPDTIVNPERRGLSPHAAPFPVGGGSSIHNLLFPPSLPALDTDSQFSVEGLRVGHFVIQERIGIGGMGAVFKAVDRSLQRIVAMKVLAPQLAADPASLQRFENEARAAACFNHDNIARVYFVGQDQGLHFIAYEYVKGTNLRDLIQRAGQLEPADAVNYGLQIASALKHTSAANFIHRDIKPSNIIITSHGRAKLVDLGLARLNEQDSGDDLTRPGTTLGTFDYISPEQAKDPRQVDIRSDIYSLGCTLYHVLAGSPPYPEGTMLQKVLDHQGKDAPDAVLKNPSVSPRLSAVIQKMMASDPRDRFARPDDIIRDLLPIAVELGLRGTYPEGLVWTSPKFERPSFWVRHLGWIVSAAVLLLIVFLWDLVPGIAKRLRSPEDSLPQSTLTENANTPTGESPSVLSNTRPPNNAMAKNNLQQSVVVSPTNSAPDFENNDAVTLEPLEPATATTSASADRSPRIGKPRDRNADVATGNDKLFDSIPSVANPRRLDVPHPEKAIPPANDAKPSVPVEAPKPYDVAGINLAQPPVESARPPSLPIERAPPSISILSTKNGKPAVYPTLEAACADAQDGDVIELSYDGRRKAPPEKKPLLVTKEITIRAGKNSDGIPYRPVIIFDAGDNPAEADSRPITLIGGKLELINVGLEFSIRENIALTDWALFSIHGAETVRLKGVTLSVINPQNRPATVFELVTGSGRSRSNMETMAESQTTLPQDFGIEIQQSFIRGSCDLFTTRHTKPGQFEIKNTAISLKGTLLHLIGDLDVPAENVNIKLNLEHITGVIGDSLVKMDSGNEMRELLPVHVTARNNIFSTNTDNALIAMTGNTNMRDFRQLLQWRGANNYYDQFKKLWSIAPSQTTASIDDFEFNAWKSYWGADTEVDANNDGIDWKNQWRGRKELSDITPTDLQLLPSTANAFEATDGSDVGADLSQFLTRRK